MNTTTPLQHPESPQRVILVDALRGFALMGLFLVHSIELFELYWQNPVDSLVHDVVFFLFALPVAVAGLALTFGTFNGRPMFIYAGPMFNFFTAEKVRIFKRLPPDVSMIQTKKAETLTVDVGKKIIEAPASRLKRLAYLLDQKSEEENKLISQS